MPNRKRKVGSRAEESNVVAGLLQLLLLIGGAAGAVYIGSLIINIGSGNTHVEDNDSCFLCFWNNGSGNEAATSPTNEPFTPPVPDATPTFVITPNPFATPTQPAPANGGIVLPNDDCTNLPFEEDFDSALSSCWQLSGNATHSPTNGFMQLSGVGIGFAQARVGAVQWDDYCVSFRVRSVQGNDHDTGGLIVRFRQATIGNNYGLALDFDNPNFVFGRNGNNVWQTLSSGLAPLSSGSAWSDVQIAVRGSTISVTVNGSVITNVPDNVYANGGIEFVVPQGTKVIHLDDVRVAETC